MAIPWILIGAYVGLTVLNYFAERANRKSNEPTPDQLQIPRIEEGRAIPVVFGTCMIDSPQVLWIGDTTAQAVQSEGITTHYRYLGTMYLGICHGPLTGAEDFFFQADLGQDWQWFYDSSGLPIGVFGAMDELTYAMLSDKNRQDEQFPLYGYPFSGDAAQTIVAPAGFTGNWPSLRGICSLKLYNFLGIDPVLPAIKVLVSRLPHNLTYSGADDQYKIEGGNTEPLVVKRYDSNPAEIIYEILTNQVWGLGLPSTMIDTDSFVTAGETLYDEGFGLSMRFDQQVSGESMIQEVLRHIEAILYADPDNDGKLTLKLLRDDYDPDGLNTYDESKILSLNEFSRPAWFDLVNEVRIGYSALELIDLDPEGSKYLFNPKVAQAQDGALFSLQGGFVSTKIDYPGITSPSTANKVASRDLRELSTPLATCKLTVNRTAYNLKPGSCFKLTWTPLGISGLIMRVIDIDYGTLDDSAIRITAIEDIFAQGTAVFASPPPTEWEGGAADVVGFGNSFGNAFGGAI